MIVAILQGQAYERDRFRSITNVYCGVCGHRLARLCYCRSQAGVLENAKFVTESFAKSISVSLEKSVSVASAVTDSWCETPENTQEDPPKITKNSCYWVALSCDELALMVKI